MSGVYCIQLTGEKLQYLGGKFRIRKQITDYLKMIQREEVYDNFECVYRIERNSSIKGGRNGRNEMRVEKLWMKK